MSALVEFSLSTLLDVSIKAIFLSVLAGFFLVCLRSRDRNVHHGVWSAVLLAMLLLPALAHLSPSIPLPQRWVRFVSIDTEFGAARRQANMFHTTNAPNGYRAEETSVGGPAQHGIASRGRGKHPAGQPGHGPVRAASAVGGAADAEMSNGRVGSALAETKPAVLAEPTLSRATPTWALALFVVYTIGLAVFGARLCLGLYLTQRILRRAQPIHPSHESKTPIKVSDLVHVPLTAGIVRPCILLPTDWATWDAKMLSSVLRHEQAHIDRRDHVLALMAELNRCLYWFHPAAWLLRRKLAVLAEHNCDDQVILATGDRGAYAQHLVNIAGRMTGMSPRLAPLGISMARVSQVESRVDAILDSNRPLAQPLGWRRILLLTAVALPMIGVTAALRAEGESVTVASEPKRDKQSPEAESNQARGDSAIVARLNPNSTKESDSASLPSPATDLYGDAIPHGAAVRLGTERFRVFNGWRGDIVFSRDGQTLVSVAESGELRWWESRTGRLRKAVNMENLNTRAIALSSDGAQFAVMGSRYIASERRMENAIQIWDIDSSERINEISWAPDQKGQRESMVYIPDGKSIITGNGGGMLRVWDLTKKEALLDLHLPDDGDITSLAVSPDGRLIAAASSEKLYVWKWLEGEEPKAIEGITNVTAVSFSPSGKQLAVASHRNSYRATKLVLWDLTLEQPTHVFRSPALNYFRANDLKFSPDGVLLVVPNGQYVTSTPNKDAVLIWNTETGELVRRLQSDNSLGSVALSRDQEIIAAIGGSAIDVWDLKTGEPIANDVSHTEIVSSVRFTPDDAQVVTSSHDGTARIWDTSTGRLVRTLRHDQWISAMSISPDGQWIATSSLDDTVRLWERSTGKQIHRLAGHGKSGGNRAVAFSEDSSRFASWGDDMHLRVWSVATGKALLDEPIKPGGKLFKNNSSPIGPDMKSGVLSPNASALLVSIIEGTYLFDVATGDQIKQIPSDEEITSACFTPDASKILFVRPTEKQTQIPLKTGGTRSSGPNKHEFVLMNLRDDSILWKFPVDGLYGPMAVSPDGRLIAVSARFDDGYDNLFLLDAATGKKLATIPKIHKIGWASNGRKLAFSGDGRWLAAALLDTSTLVWRLADIGVVR